MTDLRIVPQRLEPPFDMSVPTPRPGRDDALLEASRRLRSLEDFWNDQADPPEDSYADEVSALQHFIAKTPAIGVAGVRVKFEKVLGLDSLSGAAIGPDLVETITEALDRLAGSRCPPAAPGASLALIVTLTIPQLSPAPTGGAFLLMPGQESRRSKPREVVDDDEEGKCRNCGERPHPPQSPRRQDRE